MSSFPISFTLCFGFDFQLKILDLLRFVTTTTMLLLFGPKMFIVFVHPDRNNTDYLNNQESSSLKGFHLKQIGDRGSQAITGLDLNSISMTCTGWLLVNEDKAWSQWKKAYAYKAGEFFGLYDDEDVSLP